MLNESVEPASVLTEEELTLNEKVLYNSFRAKSMYETDHNLIDDIVASHRAIQERNRLLVLENDELMAENAKLKEALTTIAECEVPYAPITIYSVKEFYEKTAKEALEGLKHE